MTFPATIFAPEFLRLEHGELKRLLNVLRSPLATQVFLILLSQADFKTGQALLSYARLIELCTPPPPERGRRPAGPSLKQVRNAVDALIAANLIARNAERNAHQGMLHLRVRPRNKAATKKARQAD
ncbi:MAG: hypothetical protein U1E12_10260 [Hydrogenophaga sp.]|uniref:hypothetical protein n=1 Tax=Hydrogenophaga sp. TaxID=1904254 RepID=UPI002AB8A192|nr:hypothetical protein [Hydrogenophaga sp.]MDZ4102045.1 hypothetical protein [Hydrogenophaga sp.]